MLGYKIISRNPDFAVVHFYHPTWQERNVIDGVDKNEYPVFEHHVRLPKQVVGEDYETITFPRHILESVRSIQIKMERDK